MNIISNLVNNTDFIETASYFSCEIILLAAFLLNIMIFVFFKKNSKLKTASAVLTFSVFLFNLILNTYNYFFNLNNLQYSTTFFNNIFYVDINVAFLKTVVSLFVLLFFISTHKLISSSSYKVSYINGVLCLISFVAFLFLYSNNTFLTFLFLDCIVYLIYKCSSLYKLKSYEFYSSEYLIINVISSVILYSAVFMLSVCDSDFQIAILNPCLFMAYMLKIGIFPFVNYFSFKKHKKDLQYVIFLYAFLPFLGILGLTKIFDSCVLSGDIFLISSIMFLLLCVANILIAAMKTKNTVRFLCACSQFFAVFMILDFLVSLDVDYTVKLAPLYMFAIFAVFSLLCIFKINNKNEKLSINNFKGLFMTNRTFTFLFSTSLLVLFSVIPTALTKYSIISIKNIYSYDKAGYILFIFLLMSFIALIVKVFDIIIVCYNFDSAAKISKFSKKTTFNYVAFYIALIFLLLFIL